MKQSISVVIPAFNEEENIIPLYRELHPVLASIGEYEIIFVDDGSSDSTSEKVIYLTKKDSRVKLVKFRRNFGQGCAIDAGIKQAKGDIIVYIDCDMQVDPADLPSMVSKLGKGYDAVVGWRWKRKDGFFKKLFSVLAGMLRTYVTGVKVHDAGCPLKVMTREAAKSLDLGREMHRYIVWLLIMQGFRICEVQINHRQRRFGTTKYGMERLLHGFLDMFVIKFWLQYGTRPIHLFGGAGLLFMFFGFLSGIWLLIEKFVYGEAIAGRPALLLCILLLVLGAQALFSGLMMDVIVKLYSKQKGPGYVIEKIVG